VSDRTIHYRTCPLCEAMCGLEIHVEGDAVPLIRADRDDVWSKGFLCPKGTTLGHLHHDPDRLREPMIRTGDTWRTVGWDEAFARCETLIHRVLDDAGKAALTAYVGNPTAHNFSLGRYIGLFMGLADFPMIYSAGTVDQWPKNVACALMYGNMWQIPAPDIQRTDYWMVMGANPQASQGSLLACPDVLGEIDRIRDRGGRTVVIDPRRTGTADKADEWIPIVPGTDAAFLLAVTHVLFADDLVDLGDVADLVAGVEGVRDACRDFSPEQVASTCGIDAATIRRLAHELAAAPRGVLYGRIGLCNQEFGTLASWLIDVVNILTAHFDRPGGLMFGNPIAWSLSSLPNPQWADGYEFGRWRSRVRGAPEVLGQVPVSCLAEEIATPGDGQIRGLITIAGNPVISAPDAGRLDAALGGLDCLISVDNYLNETTRHADVILPGLSALEQPHYDELLWSWAARSAGNYSPPIFARPDRPHEWEILTRLGALCAGMRNDDIDIGALDDGFTAALAEAKGLNGADVLAHYDHGGPERLLDLAIRTGPWGDRYGDDPDGLTLESCKAAPHGIDRGPMIPRAREVVCTPSGRIELAPPYILGDLPRLRARLDQQRGDGLVLISRRHLRSNNSWMHNVPVLVKGKDRCTLLIHPADADRVGVRDGTVARVSSEAGAVDVPVVVTDEMMPGVVSLPHGWGHNVDGIQLAVAREHAGVNNNLLAPGHLVDAISGNAVVNGIPVEVVPA
jgi:anaerobic selenocysteine-containing dehydrogenase